MRALAGVFQAAVLLAISTQSADAYTQAWASVYAASQDGTSDKATVGLIADATTDMAKLYVGGGYTLTCAGSSTTATAQRSLTVNKAFGEILVSQDVNIPTSLPAKYPIAGFDSWVIGAAHQCTLAYKAFAAGTASGVSLTLTGVGVSGGAEESGENGNTRFFNMVKPYPPRHHPTASQGSTAASHNGTGDTPMRGRNFERLSAAVLFAFSSISWAQSCSTQRRALTPGTPDRSRWIAAPAQTGGPVCRTRGRVFLRARTRRASGGNNRACPRR